MSFKITEKFLKQGCQNRPGVKKTALNAIIVHYTANPNAPAINNRNYFESTTAYASSEYIVDDKEILYIIPENEVAYHSGSGSGYTDIGKKLMNGAKTPNYTTIGIEACNIKFGDWQTVEENTIKLIYHIWKKNNRQLPLYRHYDVVANRKKCPAMYVNEQSWKNFKEKVRRGWVNAQKGLEPDFGYWNKQATVNTNNVNVRKGPGTAWDVIRQFNKGDIVNVYEEIAVGWMRIDGGYISKELLSNIIDKPSKPTPPPVIKPEENIKIKYGITLPVVRPEGTILLPIRNKPDTYAAQVGTLKEGTIVKLLAFENNWWKIDEGQWIFKQYVNELKDAKTINHDVELFDETFKKVGMIKDGTKINIGSTIKRNGINYTYVAVISTGVTGYIEELFS